jgi:hypothetical protein
LVRVLWLTPISATQEAEIGGLVFNQFRQNFVRPYLKNQAGYAGTCL